MSHTKHASLTLKGVHARRVGVVVRTCRGCGTLVVSFGGKKLRTVRLASKHSRTVVALAEAFGSIKSGTLKVAVKSKKRKVQVDGFVVSRSARVKRARSRALRVQH